MASAGEEATTRRAEDGETEDERARLEAKAAAGLVLTDEELARLRAAQPAPEDERARLEAKAAAGLVLTDEELARLRAAQPAPEAAPAPAAPAPAASSEAPGSSSPPAATAELDRVPSRMRRAPLSQYMLGMPETDDVRSEATGVVHIEHCRDCHEHAWCTRHDEEKYKQAAVEIEYACMDAFPNIQVVTNDARFLRSHGEGKPRIGAFEVVLETPGLGMFLVFSKVLSNKWPRAERVLGDITGVLERNSGDKARTLAQITDASRWTEAPDPESPRLTAANAVQLLECPRWLAPKPRLNGAMAMNLMPPIPPMRFKRTYLDQLTMGARLKELGVTNPSWRANGRLDLRATQKASVPARPSSALPARRSAAASRAARPASAAPTRMRPQSARPGAAPARPSARELSDKYSAASVDRELKMLQQELDALA